MKNDNTKVLMLLGFLVVVGLGFMFFAGNNPEKQDVTEQKTQVDTEKSNSNSILTESENEVFEKNLMELKEIIVKLDQKDLKLFKEQTKEAFNTLAKLIKEVAQSSEETNKEIEEKTMELKKAVETIDMIENEEKIVKQIKEGIYATAEALEEIIKNTDSEKESAKNFKETAEKKLEVIKTKAEKIDMKNYKQVTKELLMDFHTLIVYIHKEMKTPEVINKSNNADEETEDNKDEEIKDKNEETKDKTSNKLEKQITKAEKKKEEVVKKTPKTKKKKSKGCKIKDLDGKKQCGE